VSSGFLRHFHSFFSEFGGLIDAPERVVASRAQIARRVGAIGRRISKDYAGRRVHLVTILRGGLFFLTDLARAVSLPVSIDCLGISSYAAGGGGRVRITKDLDEDIAGLDVLIVEDIIDTGLTLHTILRALRERDPASLHVCALFDRPYRRIAEVPLRYVGFEAPDEFLVGYGLDWRGLYRNLPYVATLNTVGTAPEAGALSLPETS
jgi:hypoxanthine phosphoribosyltransferase